MPLSRDGGMDNLFTALEGVAPDLRHRAQTFEPAQGLIVEAIQLQLDAGGPGRRDARVLSLSLLKLDSERLMAVLGDVTQVVRRERELRQSHAWINSLVTGISDYALMSLDHLGRVQTWNPGIERVAGFDAAATADQPYSIFYPRDGISAERLLDRLHEADQSGWSLDEGWRQRADGSRFWGSCLIAPLHAAEETSPTGATPTRRCAVRWTATTSPGWPTAAPSSRRPNSSCSAGGAFRARCRW
jgi:PAS domain S-box-containing protein